MAGTEAPDLTKAWRDAMREWEQQTNAALNRLSGAEQFSQGMNQGLSALLKAQAAYGEAVEQALVRMNLPSRADFRALSAKLDDLERKIDALGAALSGSRDAAGADSPARAQPPRTRRAPRADREDDA